MVNTWAKELTASILRCKNRPTPGDDRFLPPMVTSATSENQATCDGKPVAFQLVFNIALCLVNE
ncbi:unnamed protein product [Acanthoscelides obtectus]|uniref:Uncharacterized protein n=1 Tax=Acanthoscelides obtectus TaxID=200917 RepID=A0A9P0LEL8_ACAOB|nr:unnamed protein product [Acanthoscelides obtectus]CAH1981153.1 unnamed protein product [Acanthoscelides obtectus]CAH1991594.1 unnamed protein product [Acanthoscelides obtectus]CAH2013569.1 unnamed protein product [Acanthoscelides obtectus]CAK1622688.1 hypothetical protein AOBTE_LOCUS1624 [Acanthoscelides obtectus]